MEVVDRLRELGLFGLNLPTGYDRVSRALAFEEIACAGLGPAGLLGPHSVACLLVAGSGTLVQRARYLPAMATGDLPSGLGLTEPGAGRDLSGITATAVRQGNQYVVSGVKRWPPAAPLGGLLVVLVKLRRPGGPRGAPCLLLVETAAAGCAVTAADLVLDEVRVPAENLLGGVEGQGIAQVRAVLDGARPLLVGAAR